MTLYDQQHTVRFPLPDLIVRGRAHTLRAPVYLSGELVAPSSATVSVYDASGVAQVSAAADTITSSVATYTIGAGTLSASALGEGWSVEWVITLSTGAILLPVNSAALVRCALYPVITDDDLIRRCPELDPDGAAPITSAMSFQDAIDEAWTEINLRLISKGSRPNLVREPSAFRQCHLFLALALRYEGEQTRLSAAYGEKAAHYRALYEAAWSELNPQYSSGDDLQADARRRSMTPTIWLGGGAGRTTRTGW
jgi:hypothetical protein